MWNSAEVGGQFAVAAILRQFRSGTLNDSSVSFSRIRLKISVSLGNARSPDGQWQLYFEHRGCRGRSARAERLSTR
jgi:hypothetical protein